MSIKLDNTNNSISTENNVLTIDSNGALVLPFGQTRPLAPSTAMTRVNNSQTDAKLEFYDGNKWEIVVSNETGTIDNIIPYIIAQNTM